VLIWRGGEKTKRVEKVRARLRAALAAEHPSSPTALQDSTQGATITTSISRAAPGPNDTDDLEVPENISVRATLGTVRFAESNPSPVTPQRQTQTPDIEIDELMTIPKRT